MTKTLFEWRPQVQLDLYDIASYIARDNFTAAIAFVDAVERTMDDLAISPALGRVRTFRNSRLSNFRSFSVRGFPNCLIFYELGVSVDHNMVSVVRILHAARDIESAL